MASNSLNLSWSEIASSKPKPKHTPSTPSEDHIARVNDSISVHPKIQARNESTPVPGSSYAATSSLQNPKLKKKNKPNKEARIKKREQKALRAIYGPKDSHIHMISAEVLQKLKNEVPVLGPSRNINRPPRKLLFEDPPHVVPQTVIYKSTNQTQNAWGLVRVPVSTTESNAATLEQDFPSLSLDTRPHPQNDEAGWITDEEKEERKFSETEADPSLTLRPDEISILNSTTSIQFSKKKPSKNPMLVSLGVLASNTTKHSRKKDKLQTQRKSKAEKSLILNRGNILDSSGVIYKHRGKMREKPKKKKLSKLKLAILKSRLIRAEKARSAVLERGTDAVQVKQESQSVEEVSDATFSLEDWQFESSNIKIDPEIQFDIISASQNIEDFQAVKIEPDLKLVNEDDNIFRKLFDDALKLSDDTKPCSNESNNLNETEKIHEDLKSEPTIPSDIIEEVKTSMHSRKFRKYCDMYVSKELHGHVISVMSELFKFQDRLYHSDPIKYQSKKRFIHGIKDVILYSKLNKLQLVIIAPDIEPNNAKGGLDEKLDEIITLAKQNNVPYVFSGNRYILGKPMRIKNPVSVIGILNKQGTEDSVKQLLEEATKLRDSYNSTFHSRAMIKMSERKIR